MKNDITIMLEDGTEVSLPVYLRKTYGKEIGESKIALTTRASKQLIDWIEKDHESLNSDLNIISETIAYLAVKLDYEKDRDHDRLKYLIMSLGYIYDTLLRFKPVDNNY